MKQELGTRELILARAQELFLAQGYHRTSMREIAKAAGVSTGPLYFHFQNKAEVFFHICCDAMDRIVEVWRRTAGEDGHAGHRLRNIYLAYKDFSLRETKLFEVLQLATNPMAGVDLPPHLREALDRKFSEQLQVMEEIIRIGVERKELRPVEPRELALYLYSVSEGVFMANRTGVLQRAGIDLNHMVDIAIDLIGVGMVNLADRPQCDQHESPRRGTNGG